MHSRKYTQLYKVYKYLLTLPSTQVTCERSFSVLKLIKTRIRSTIDDMHLEAFMLMACEPELLQSVEADFIILKLCQSSTEISRLLQV